SEHRPAAWIKPAIAGGGLVVAVVLIGAFAGWNAGNGEASQAAEPGVRVALPPPGPRPAAVSPAPAPASEAPVAQRRQPPRAAIASARIKHSPPIARPGLPADFLAQAAPAQRAPTGDVPAAAAAVAEAPPGETAAALP